jgi:hypothetical protein
VRLAHAGEELVDHREELRGVRRIVAVVDVPLGLAQLAARALQLELLVGLEHRGDLGADRGDLGERRRLLGVGQRGEEALGRGERAIQIVDPVALDLIARLGDPTLGCR